MRTPRVVALLALIAAPAMLAACPNSDRVGDGILKPIDADATYDTSRPDAPDQRGVTGDPCAVGAECQSGLCTPAAAGGVCTESCTDTCPEGFLCAPADASGTANVCWSLDAVACQPCDADEQCELGGVAGNKCVSYGAAGSFCGLACGAGDACPDGFACAEGQCVKDAGAQCECNAAGILAGASTSCAVDNDAGSCAGERRCTSGGLTRCDAPTPLAETCDGRDQNCDGQTDEGTDGQECTLTNEFGTCIGAVQCTVGKPLCVGRAPAAEICNGVDDDCDGLTDEDQPDLDLDTIPDCLDDDIDGDGSLNPDDCAPRNKDIYPGQTEVCNGIDDNCNHMVDEGTDLTSEDECGCYVCAGVTGCRDDCTKDAHCITGYLCDLFDDDDNGNANECLPSVCGNGDVEIREVCDDGTNDGGYGGCLQGCGGLGPRCGDGLRQAAHEVCDDGTALNGTPNHCNSTCTGPTPPECGNGVVEVGEGCDLGAGVNSNAPNAECRTDCSVRRCGDGVVDDGSEEACDAGETANGETVCGCQQGCVWASPEVTCRAATDGGCDVAETCNGSGACPVDGFLTGVVCHPSTGGCDPAEVCSGSSPDCPADLLDDNGTVCHPSTGGCDPAETCDGVSAACPDDHISPPQTVCRGAAGDCDVVELCNGESAACPDDEYYASSVICRGSEGLCDAAERCTGEGPACPADAVLSALATCRAAVGTCDTAELCDGQAKACPDDVIAAADTVCHPSQGPCDVEEVCDGESGVCPDDALADAGTECRAGNGSCNPAEACDGESAGCPADALADDDTACTVGEGNCGFAPCWCQSGECQQLCGDGVVQGNPDDNSTPPMVLAPILGGELCDAGDMNGARDGCSMMCDGLCDADFGWVIPAGGTDRDGGNGVAVDEAGGSVAVGEFTAYPDNYLYAPELPSAPLDVPYGAAVFGDEWFYSDYSADFWVMAQDTDGNPRWAACGGGSYDDVANGVDNDDAGDVYVTGRFGAVATVDCCELNGGVVPQVAVLPGGDCEHTLESTGSYSDSEEVFLAKWSNDGVVQWAVSGGSWGPDSGEDVATDSVGRSVVVGYHSGDSFGGAWFGDQVVYGTGYRDVFVAKYDKNGNALWAHGGGSNYEDAAQGVALDGAGNIYVTGYFGADFLWDDNATSFDTGPVEGSSLFVLGLDAEGENPWVLTAYASNGYGDVGGTDIVADGAGNAYVTGYFEGGGAVFGDIEVSTGGNSSDMFVAKISGGAWDWVAVASDEDMGYGYDPSEVGFGVAVDRSGKVYVTGEFNDHIQFGAISLDSGCGSNCWPAAPGLPSQAAYFYGGDGFVAKLSAAGEWLWAKQMGGYGVGPTTSRDIGVDPKGNIYTSGGYSGPATFDAITVDPLGGDVIMPMAPSFSYSQDAFVAKMVPDGGPRCYDCGDGVVDPGEGCDDADGLDHCAGTCDGICFGPANACGDGWDECEEQYDVGGGAADLGMCLLPAGNLWCFQTGANSFTYDPVEPGVPAAIGPGVKEEVPLTGLGGNPTQHPDCPLCNPLDANVDCRSGSARQWGGDGPPIDSSTTARTVCDGNLDTPPCGTNVIGCSSTATNDEAAAIECGDFYEFVANTGPDVAFEFDELTRTQGPTAWSLWVSLTGADGSWTQMASGPTTQAATSDFGAGRPTPMHVVVLTDATTDRGAVTDQLGVHFRLYAWGATSIDAPWTVDNVRVGEPTYSADLSGVIAHWSGDDTTADAVGGYDGAWTGSEGYSDSARCGAFWFDDNASNYVAVGAAAALEPANVSLSAWFSRDDNTTVAGDREVIAAQWAGAEKASYGLSVVAGKLTLEVWPTADVATYKVLTGPTVADREWHHAVGTYDGARLALYLDGVQVAAMAYAGGAMAGQGGGFGIGGSTQDHGFRGSVDEVMVFGRALDQTSVSSLYFGQLVRTDCAAPPAVPIVIITEIVDGDMTGGLPKFFELTNIGTAAADLSSYQVGRYSNGAATPSSLVTLSGTLEPGASFVIASESATFTTLVYGFGPNLVNGAANNNGDDGVVLLDATGGVVDIYGVPGISGAGQPWEYTDGYAYRNANVTAPNATFALSEWTFGGKASLDAPDDATRLTLLRGNTTPGAHAN